MPIYIKFDGIKGDVTPDGAIGGGPHIKVYSGSTGRSALPADAVEISRISLSPAGGGVDGGDPAARSKVEQMIASVRRLGTSGKLYIATEAGVYRNSVAKFDGRGRLLSGNDAGIWRSAGASKHRVTNNLKQFGLAALNTTIEIYITTANGIVLDKHRLERATVSRHPGVVNVAFCDGSVRF